MNDQKPKHHFEAQNPTEKIRTGMIALVFSEIWGAPLSGPELEASRKRVQRLLAWWKRRPPETLQ